MGIYGPEYTWKVVYWPKVSNGGIKGVALVEAASRSDAMFAFQQQYAGQFTTLESITKVL